MKKLLIAAGILYTFSCHSQSLKGISSKGPAQETIFQVRKESDAAFVLNVQSIVLDTCGTFSSETTYVVTGKIIKKYFDKTGKFKNVKITYLTTDTAPYTKEPYHIVFVKQANQELAGKCKGFDWVSHPGTAFVFSTKTETMVGKKEE